MQMDSTTPPDSVFHLFVLLCTLIVSCQFAHALIPYYRSNKILYIYIYLFIYFVTVSYMHIPYYMD